MRRSLLLVLSMVGFGLIAAGSASAAQVTYCPQPPSTQYIGFVDAPGDLVVPPGTSCGPTEGSTIGHDVIVSDGASFFPGGTTVGNDVLSFGADLIELGDPNNGTTDMIVGHNVIISGTQGSLPFGQFICQTRIGHNLVIKGTAASVSQWYIGYQNPSNCGRNYGRGGDTVGGNGIFRGNANTIYVGDNNNEFNGGTGLGFGHDLFFGNNDGAINQLSDNSVGYDCAQANNHPFLGFLNTAGNSVDACNTSNP